MLAYCCGSRCLVKCWYTGVVAVLQVFLISFVENIKIQFSYAVIKCLIMRNIEEILWWLWLLRQVSLFIQVFVCIILQVVRVDFDSCEYCCLLQV
jgi:hypothetical protein